MKTYDVHAYVTVRVKYVGIEAATQADAIAQVREEGLDLHTRLSSDYQHGTGWPSNRHIPNPLGHMIDHYEYDDGEKPAYWLVDEQGDEEFERSRWYNRDEQLAPPHKLFT